MNNSAEKNLSNLMISIGKNARSAAHSLAMIPTKKKNQALIAMAAALRDHQPAILAANKQDIAAAEKNAISSAFLDRLKLTDERLEAMATGLENIAELPDPVGSILATIKRPNGLIINRVRVPIGVIGVIYESRPNVTADAAGLCLKSGNAVILRGGSDSFYSAAAIVKALHEGLKKTELPITLIQMIPTAERSAVVEMLMMDKYIDVIIPRGGPELIARIAQESRIPLFKHLAGICHTYIHQAANKEMARTIVMNAKMRRTGICGATETLIIDEKILHSHLPAIIDDLINAGCEIRGDAQAAQLDARIKPVQAGDYDTEYLDAIIAVKTVKNLTAAIAHIAEHSTQHTDAIITDDLIAAQQFLNQVDSAIVIHNASTQFADGGEFGMGAEIGIATGKLHARGPVGVEQLTTFKYQVHGNGQIRS